MPIYKKNLYGKFNFSSNYDNFRRHSGALVYVTFPTVC